MTVKRHIALKLAILLTCMSAFPCFADEILFRNEKGFQTGVVVGEDDQSVTIRFSKEAIKSITRSGKENSTPLSGKVIWEEGDQYLILKIPRRSIQVMPLETHAVPPAMIPEPVPPAASQGKEGVIQAGEQPEKIGKAVNGRPSVSPAPLNTQHELLEEEMGSVQGVIHWRGKPLQNAKVKIVLERYTGFSLAALKRFFSSDKDKVPRDEIVLETQTDSQGRYIFHKAPPGDYRLYWLPDANTGWVRRLREKPDFEVTAGNITSADVPEKKK